MFFFKIASVLANTYVWKARSSQTTTCLGKSYRSWKKPCISVKLIFIIVTWKVRVFRSNYENSSDRNIDSRERPKFSRHCVWEIIINVRETITNIWLIEFPKHELLYNWIQKCIFYLNGTCLLVVIVIWNFKKSYFWSGSWTSLKHDVKSLPNLDNIYWWFVLVPNLESTEPWSS